MSDDQGTKPEAPPELPPISELWKKPETDTRLIITFIGDSPDVQTIGMVNCTIGHYWAAAQRLIYEGNKIQMEHDRQQAAHGIRIAQKLPDEEKTILRP